MYDHMYAYIIPITTKYHASYRKQQYIQSVDLVKITCSGSIRIIIMLLTYDNWFYELRCCEEIIS